MRRFDLPGRSAVIAANGIAATSHPLASATALSVLRERGNAVDAAIAAMATLAVVEPHMTGIGGDSFAIVAEPNGRVHGLNGSGRAAAGAKLDWYIDAGFSEIPQHSAHSVTVPGALRAWEMLHEQFGSIAFERLFADAIAYAEDGCPVAPRVAFDWAKEAVRLGRDAGARQHYLLNGRTPLAGEKIRLPALAATLRLIAKFGSKALYEGSVAAEIVEVVQAQGGVLTEEDLASVRPDWVQPIGADYAGQKVLELPPNGTGMVALILFNLLEILGTRRMPPDSADRYHCEIEAARVAYAVRDTMLADPDCMSVSVKELTSPAYAERLAGKIDPLRRNPDLELPPLPGAHTVYLTVADRDGQVVSLISSISGVFGSQIATPRSGILLHNRGGSFRVEVGHPNAIGPGKRPMHTIIPAMAVEDGKVSVSFGVMGGAFQPMGHAHVFANFADYGMDPQEAIDHGRLFWDDSGSLGFEAGIRAGVLETLKLMGHRVHAASTPWGGAQMIVIDHKRGCYIAGSDPRKDGQAVGY
ncbi:gamma-glutamyltransferase family protein [Mesorhizobium sp. M0618]|uniref:gamma-glutamyltransferase family protein n=1 Tax=unclassified Mesorhizobium TaxID=325217 RepID=UPI003336E5C4